jgi:hypothetical protein
VYVILFYVGKLTAGRPGDRGSIPGTGERIIPLAPVSRPALRPTQPPVQWAPGVLFPGLQRGRGVTLTTHLHLVPRSRMRSYISSPPNAFVVCSGTALDFLGRLISHYLYITVPTATGRYHSLIWLSKIFCCIHCSLNVILCVRSSPFALQLNHFRSKKNILSDVTYLHLSYIYKNLSECDAEIKKVTLIQAFYNIRQKLSNHKQWPPD